MLCADVLVCLCRMRTLFTSMLQCVRRCETAWQGPVSPQRDVCVLCAHWVGVLGPGCVHTSRQPLAQLSALAVSVEEA